MKKLILVSGALAIGCLATAQHIQHPVNVAPEHNVAIKSNKIALTGYEVGPQQQTVKPYKEVQHKAVNEVIIGETLYDLETNSSVQPRLINNPDGTMMGTWTFSDQVSPFNDRGTGYVHYDGSNWDGIPTARIETQRTGWPTMLVTGSGAEVVLSHGGSGGIVMNKRATYGTGSWSETTVPTNTGHWFLWNRAAVGGATNNTIHMVALSAPVANGGTMLNGQDGSLLYYRSLDEGVTWDQMDVVLPGMDSTFFNRFRADSYSLIADGDNVALVVFNQWADMILMKSTDNGTTWTKSIINDFEIDLFVTDQGSDWDNNGSYDTLTTCDESGSAIFDQNGMVHVWFGNMRVLDADLNDGNTSYFPGTNGLMYWNEAMGTDNHVMIAQAEDVNGDQVLDWGGAWALYYTSLSSMSSVGINADGTLFVAYAGYREDFTTIDQNYRHIYVMKSTDNGATWSTPRDVTPDENLDYLEHVFPTVADHVDDKMRLIFMRDWEPGLHVRGDMDNVGINEYIYLEVDTVLESLVGMENALSIAPTLEMYPNPTNGALNLTFNLYNSEPISVSIIDLLGKEVLPIQSGSIQTGLQTVQTDVSGLAAGTYFVRLQQGEHQVVEKLVLQKE